MSRCLNLGPKTSLCLGSEPTLLVWKPNLRSRLKSLLNKLLFSVEVCVLLKYCMLYSFADAVQETLGFDWLLLFIQAHLHNTTVVRATRILVTMLSSVPALNRFREGLGSGSWLDGTDIMLNKTTYVVAGIS